MLRKPDDKEQSKAFIEKAREIGADERRSAAGWKSRDSERIFGE
jgi:hypothetical protein